MKTNITVLIWLLMLIMLSLLIVYGYLCYKKIDNTNTKVATIYDWIELTKKEGLIINCE